jgi:hypothetical protein
MSESEKPSRAAIQKPVASPPERQKLEAALEALEAEKHRRREARGEPDLSVEICTGVPRPPPCPEGCTCWRHSKEPAYDVQAERARLEKHLEPPSPPRRKQPPAEPPPLTLPREWKYVFTQVRAGDPDKNDFGQILDGQYGVSGNWLYLESTSGEPLGRVRLEAGADPAAIARQMLKAKYQVKGGPAGFYDPIPNNGRTLH